MNNFLLFVTGPLPGPTLPATYNGWLAVLSFIVATLAAYTAIELAERVREFRTEPRKAAAWLAGGAVAMGAGIWSMHFVAMLAYQLPVPVRYELWTTVISMAVAIVASGFALFIVTRIVASFPRIALSGAVMGVGIVAMHYTGMAAMRLDALIMYYPVPFALSIVNAVLCSTAALWLISRRENANSTPTRSKVLAAVVMGVAIAGMHYTGMVAAVFVSTGTGASAAGGLDPALLALAVTGITLLVMGMALALSLQSQLMTQILREQNLTLKTEIDQRRAMEPELQNHRVNLQALVDARTRDLSQANRDLREGERRFRATFEQAAVGIAHFDLQRRTIKVNRRYREIVGYTEEELLGKTPGFLNHPDDDDADSALRVQLLSGAIDHYSQDRRYLRKDATAIWVTRTESLARDAAGAPLYSICVIEDITERKAVTERYRATFENAPVGIMHTDTNSDQILHLNHKLCEMLGYTQNEMLSMTTARLLHPDHESNDRYQYRDPLLRGEIGSFPAERQLVRKDGSSVYVNRTVSLVTDAAGKPVYFIHIIEDITERKRAEEARSRLAAVSDGSNDAIFIRDVERRIVYWNDGASRLYGYSLDEVMGKDSTFLVPPEYMEERERNWQRCQQGIAVTNYDTVRLRKDGTRLDVSISISLVKDPNGKIIGAATVARDITERMESERHIEQLATKDALTGLSNRYMLMEQMNSAVARATRAGTQMVVMFVDLDRFKEVNDTLGHAAGDDLLRECAKRLTECVRDVDIVARLGGDEFVVLLTDVTDTAIVTPIAERMLRSLTVPYQLLGHEAHASASVGICFYPTDGSDVTTLMKNADIAMYQAKKLNRNNFQFYSEEMNQRMMQRLQLERELRAAVENNEFELHYQPQVAVASGKFQGAEALVRWKHPTRGLLPPFEFIKVAEETGLIVPLGNWVLNRACRTIKGWRDKGVNVPYVVVNVSAAQLGEGLVRSVRQALVDHDIEAGWLMLEITESMLMENVEEAISILRRIRELGIRIALDDFGTGYSSLSILQRLPLDTLKIDRSFVSAIDDESSAARACAIIGTIIAIAKELNLSVVAEGVETTTQLAFLHTVNCDSYQGFIYSKPVDTVTLEARFVAPMRSVLEDEDGRAISMTTKVTLELPFDVQ